MNHTLLGSLLLAAAVSAPPAIAQNTAADHAAHAAHAQTAREPVAQAARVPAAQGGAASVAARPAEMSQGVLRKVDRTARRVTIEHGEIRNLAMPPMTMAFQVRDPALLAKVKQGDKVRFRAESDAGALVVTALELAR